MSSHSDLLDSPLLLQLGTLLEFCELFDLSQFLVREEDITEVGSGSPLLTSCFSLRFPITVSKRLLHSDDVKYAGNRGKSSISMELSSWFVRTGSLSAPLLFNLLPVPSR